MTDVSQPPKRKERLCVLKYGISWEDIKCNGPLDCVCYYWSERNAIQPPSLIPVTYADESGKPVDGWILPGTAAFFLRDRGGPPRDLPLTDPATRAYLDTWFPRDLSRRKAFKNVAYVNVLYPRHLPVEGIVLTVVRMRRHEVFRRMDENLAKQDWVAYHKALGDVDPVVPPDFPHTWLVDESVFPGRRGVTAS